MINWLIYNDFSQWFFSTPLGELTWNGGIWMIPLAICSIWGLATIIVKFTTLTMASIKTKKLLTQVNQFMEEQNIQGAVKLCESTPGPVAAILLAGLRKVREGSDRVLKAIENTGTIELAFLERGIMVLATLSNVAPMFGFLGTVTGMINAFSAIEKLGEVSAQAVAGGIKEALITTATGLAIAIPIQIAHNYFVSRIDKMILDMEESSQLIVEAVMDIEDKQRSTATDE
ncbi:MAG: MotA/TolQ/ExbB proton channel family protein [Candidatus Glassbacteria bacterium]|nr:MotA/TolQ/ExbB proton channel family protein [Candidatus Glassbacteria bacterium]